MYYMIQMESNQRKKDCPYRNKITELLLFLHFQLCKIVQKYIYCCWFVIYFPYSFFLSSVYMLLCIRAFYINFLPHSIIKYLLHNHYLLDFKSDKLGTLFTFSLLEQPGFKMCLLFLLSNQRVIIRLIVSISNRVSINEISIPTYIYIHIYTI